MKKALIIAFLFFSTLVCASYAKSNSESLDKIVALVNDDVVTRSELDHALIIARIQITQEHLPMPNEMVLQKQVLNKLIDKKLQLQVAKQGGINVPEQDVTNAISRVAEQNHMTINELYQRLAQDGMTAKDYRDEVHDQMTLQRLQQQQVVVRPTVSQQEVDSFLHSKVWQTNEAKEYHVEDILIPTSETLTPEQIAAAKQRSQAVITKLNQGQDSKSIAQAEASGPNALQVDDLGWRPLAEMPSAFAEQVAHLEKNQVAGPIQASNGFHILRLVDVRALASQEAAPDRKQVEALLMQRKFEEAVQNWVSKLRNQAFVVLDLAKA